MIEIKYSSPIERSSIVYFINKKVRKDIEGVEPTFVESFLQSDKKFDFLKSFSSFTLLVKDDLLQEELRVVGASVYELIEKDVEELNLIGEGKMLYHFLEGLALRSYSFDTFLSKKNSSKLNSVVLQKLPNNAWLNSLNNMLRAVFWTRDVVNMPVSHMNATDFSLEIEKLGQEAGFEVKILKKKDLEDLKMGGLLAVNRGSLQPPTFTTAEYKHPEAVNQKPIVLVGKGVMYDTGGLSLKPTPGSMDTMKSDMAGAASIIGSLFLAALEKVPLHIIALIPATDNRPGGDAYAPGDVVKMYNGSTVEVLNTDAEGRMILADALSYSDQFQPEFVLDMATLTGAAVRAIGTEAHISMGNASQELFDLLQKAGESTHERVVQFPFWEDYRKHMNSKIADIKNIGSANAGMISAGKFLEFFLDSPYIHMDVAGPTWLDQMDSYRSAGATGSGVRLLGEFFNLYALK